MLNTRVTIRRLQDFKLLKKEGTDLAHLKLIINVKLNDANVILTKCARFEKNVILIRYNKE